MGEHIKIILNENYFRYYNPISSFDTLGYADFLIKIIENNPIENTDLSNYNHK